MSQMSEDICDNCWRRRVLMPSARGDSWLCCVCVGSEHARRLEKVKPHLCPACASLSPRFYCSAFVDVWEEAA